MTFRWNVQIKTINYYTHVITLLTTHKQDWLRLDLECVCIVCVYIYTHYTHTYTHTYVYSVCVYICTYTYTHIYCIVCVYIYTYIFNPHPIKCLLILEREGEKKRETLISCLLYEGEPPKPQNLFIKNCVFILTCLNFRHLQRTPHLIQHYWHFFPLLKTVFKLIGFDAF